MARLEPTFPLVPRFRLLGVPFGAAHSARRGLGSDVAGLRPYAPGDDVGAIDWNGSARVSSARDADEFLVRERFADEAPRLVAVCDRRPAMALYPPALPWLAKADAMRMVVEILAGSTFRARGLFGYLDAAVEGEPYWNAPTSEPQWRRLEEEIAARPFSGAAANLPAALDFLGFARIALPRRSFVFVLSDFLVPVPPEAWLAARGYGWDIVPVVIQDPLWEQSFPDLAGIAIPVVDAETGTRGLLRLTRAQTAALRTAHERRLAGLLDELAGLGLDPVLVDSVDDEAILAAFLDWADRRIFVTEAWALGA